MHGDRDSVTSPQEARTFTANLRATSHAPAGLAMLPGAQHAFDLFPSIRTARRGPPAGTGERKPP